MTLSSIIKLRPAETCLTLVARLQDLAAAQPERLAYTFLSGKTLQETQLSYAELDATARQLAAELLLLGHDKAILLYEPGLEFIQAFFGCLYAGVVAIPVNLPHRTDRFTRCCAIAADSGAGLVLGPAAIRPRLPDELFQSGAHGQLQWLATDTLTTEPLTSTDLPELQPAALALLQYTSGSTATPKGVMISHANIMANQHMIQIGFGHSAETVVVGWLPHYHDMGLIGNILQPIYAGCRCILMAPMYFLQKPLRWLQAISHYKATTSGGPNFAYELCAREINPADCVGLDLSSWTLAFCGAERVHPDTIQRFSAAFKSIGFRRQAFYPCYGLAEATLIASGGHKTAPPVILRFAKADLEQHRARRSWWPGGRSIALTGCGLGLGAEQLLIVNPESASPLPVGQVGEIWLQGPNIAAGYWQKSEENLRDFQAYTADGRGPYFRSGDLGFLHQGELFVTGRCKELIIIRGQNIYPHDVEKLVTACDPALRPLSCIAFTVTQADSEQLVVLAESKQRRLQNVAEIQGKIQQVLVDEYGVSASHIGILAPLQLPRTSSGKLQRLLCREQYLAQLHAVGE